MRLLLCYKILVGQAILPAAAFQAALSRQAGILAIGKRRLKAGGCQDWLPHFSNTVVLLALFASFACSAAAADPPLRNSGHYQVTLRLPETGLFAREEMEIEFRVADTARPDTVSGFAAVVRAVPEATIDLPTMPGMPKFSAIAHAEGIPGDYGIHPTFAHGGSYRLRIAIHPPAGEPFTVEFPLEVADADQVAKRKPLPPRFRLEVAADPKRPRAGQPVELRFIVRDRDNTVIKNYEMVHESLLHLVIVRRDLSQFGHEHPALGPDGTFIFAYTFSVGGEYRLFADLAPKGEGSQILAAELKVAGDPGRVFHVQAAQMERQREAAGTTVEFVSPEGALPVRKSLPLMFRLRDTRTGEPVNDLQPYLGVLGHLMLVHEDGSTFVHSHPDDAGSLQFLARFPKPGLYRGWLQFKRAGEIRTADFVFRAEIGR